MARTVISLARRRWGIVLSLIVIVGTGLVLQAVHDLDFELDGNIVTDGSTPFNSPTIDWASLFETDGDTVDPLPGGGTTFTAAKLSRDFLTNPNGSFNTGDDTTFATGSKDTLPISTGWQCNHDANVNSKIDIMNAYAAAYKAANGDELIYFGLERNANTGDANVAFWFLQDLVGCQTATTTQSFTGDHKDGDLLIVSAFTNGGAVSTIDVYRWNIPADPSNPSDTIGALGTTPVAHGVDCRDEATGVGDSACATANTAPISVPWLTAAKTGGVGHTLPTAQFFEGGLNLTKSGLGGHCFNVFIGDTRSSQSLTATLFDYAEGVIGECTSKTETTPSISGSSAIPADPLDAKVIVTDSATVTVKGVDSFDGSVSWHLCGPSVATGTDYTCATGGVDIGSKSTTDQSSPWTVVSPEAFVTSAGRYCWRAEFTATAPDGIPGSTDNRTSECFIITPLTPTLLTTATTGPVDFGQKISDTVVLANTAHKPGTGGPDGDAGSINATTLGGDATGTIVVRAYGPDSCTTLAFTSTSIAVAGDGTYGGAGTAFEFLPSAPGQYVFVAQYSGDLPNTLGAGGSGETLCNSAPASEKVIVRQIPTEIKTKQSWIPNDTATITSTSGNLAAGGSVAFSLYNNATCSGSAVFTQTVSVNGGSPTEEVSTTNTTTFKILTGYTDPADSLTGKYSWKIVYTPAAADTAHTGKQSACDAEHFNITYTNDPGPGTALP